MAKDKHEHKYTELHEEKVRIRREGKIIVGVDTIKYHKCKCGAKLAYDLERLIASHA